MSKIQLGKYYRYIKEEDKAYCGSILFTDRLTEPFEIGYPGGFECKILYNPGDITRWIIKPGKAEEYFELLSDEEGLIYKISEE
jgi:hypothetical protein